MWKNSDHLPCLLVSLLRRNGGKRKTGPTRKPYTPEKLAPSDSETFFQNLNAIFRLWNDENEFHEKFSFPGYHGVCERKKL